MHRFRNRLLIGIFLFSLMPVLISVLLAIYTEIDILILISMCIALSVGVSLLLIGKQIYYPDIKDDMLRNVIVEYTMKSRKRRYIESEQYICDSLHAQLEPVFDGLEFEYLKTLYKKGIMASNGYIRYYNADRAIQIMYEVMDPHIFEIVHKYAVVTEEG